MERFPSELLCRVFLLGIPRYSRSSGEKYDQVKKYRLAISAVDAHWRDIALSLPFLWREVVIDLHQTDWSVPPSFDGTFNLSMLTLARSQALLIDLTIHTYTSTWVNSDPTLDRLWSLVSPHLHRCRYLSIDTNHYPFPLQGCLDNLITFECTAPLGKTSPGPLLLDLESSIPRLRNVHFTRQIHFPPDTLRLLTRLALRGSIIDFDQGLGASPLFSVLSECTSLVYLDVSFGQFLTWQPARPLKVVLNHLEYLGIESPKPWASIYSPKLKHLRVDGKMKSFDPLTPLFSTVESFTVENIVDTWEIPPMPTPPQALWDVPVLELSHERSASGILDHLVARASPPSNRSQTTSDGDDHTQLQASTSILPPPLQPKISLSLLRLGFSFVVFPDLALPIMLFHALDAYPHIEVECDIARHPDTLIRKQAAAYGSRIRITKGEPPDSLVGLQLQWSEHLLWTKGADLADEI